LFALTHEVLHNTQMSTFVAFGGFATLILASFGGSRREKALAYLGLALAGSVLLTIGTAVSSSTAVAAVVTVPVAFAVLFAGIWGPNVASAATAVLLTYVLPAASAGTIGTVPSRLAGWWLVSTVAAASVLLLSRPGPADRLRSASAAAAIAIASELEAATSGEAVDEYRSATRAAKDTLLGVNTSTPYRPTGLTTPDQALADLVEILEWSCGLLANILDDDTSLGPAAEVDRDLLGGAGRLFSEVAALLEGRDARPDLDCLERLRAESAAQLLRLRPTDKDFERLALRSFHARALAAAARTAGADALILSRRADRTTIAAARRRWFGSIDSPPRAKGRLADVGAWLASLRRFLTGNASLRSTWFQNSVRGAVALAAAVAVADLTSVQHGFWVVLGTLSVLRSNAVATGSTALRALLGTVAGFVIGGALMLAIGSDTTVLWVVFPFAVLVASYVPGTAPFAAGQAAFTVLISVLFNLLVPVGWKVGVVRVEDVALGCAVSLGVGVLFWPRGAGRVVRDELAEAFRQGGTYLTEAATWALGLGDPPRASLAAVTAGIRLDDALRGFLAEQGAKRVQREDLWRLVGGALRLRLTANSLAGLPAPVTDPSPTRVGLAEYAQQLSGWYGRLADALSSHDRTSRASLDPAGLMTAPDLHNGASAPPSAE
ncbi:MAG: FUSC family protein, partial [Acidimicrobiales bacterium]|nr:FUSC family protein [Acidimicrobiales bacterium]